MGTSKNTAVDKEVKTNNVAEEVDYTAKWKEAKENLRIQLKERATPTADADYGKIYTKTDNKLYFQDGAGTEHEISFA